MLEITFIFIVLNDVLGTIAIRIMHAPRLGGQLLTRVPVNLKVYKSDSDPNGKLKPNKCERSNQVGHDMDMWGTCVRRKH
jgi:hypothetical protein